MQKRFYHHKLSGISTNQPVHECKSLLVLSFGIFIGIFITQRALKSAFLKNDVRTYLLPKTFLKPSIKINRTIGE